MVLDPELNNLKNICGVSSEKCRNAGGCDQRKVKEGSRLLGGGMGGNDFLSTSFPCLCVSLFGPQGLHFNNSKYYV